MQPVRQQDAALQEAEEQLENIRRAYESIIKEVGKVIVGQRQVIEQMLTAMFSRGHCLVEGVPGLAKTLIVRTLSRVLSLKFSRIQFTPDLMPTDIIGTDIIQEDPETHRREFKFFPGPIFANIILADEINRTPPKTQAALLQAMQEYSVTTGGKTYQLALPFFVLATQNPIEQEGTYPLPEAQQDRFMFKVYIDYPSPAEEMEIAKLTTYDEEPEVERVVDADTILQVQRAVRAFPVSDHVIRYATELVRATRPRTDKAPDFVNEYLTWGAGPRATQYLVLGAKARACLEGRANVSCADVAAVAHPVLRHRIFTNFNADAEGIGPDAVIDRLLEAVPEPDETAYG